MVDAGAILYGVYDRVSMTNEFVAYRGDADIHDGTVLKIEKEGAQVRVLVRGATSRRYELTFSGVDSVNENRAGGMLLHALAELSTQSPLRQFVFTNWDEADEASLEVLALDVDCQLLLGD